MLNICAEEFVPSWLSNGVALHQECVENMSRPVHMPQHISALQMLRTELDRVKVLSRALHACIYRRDWVHAQLQEKPAQAANQERDDEVDALKAQLGKIVRQHIHARPVHLPQHSSALQMLRKELDRVKVLSHALHACIYRRDCVRAQVREKPAQAANRERDDEVDALKAQLGKIVRQRFNAYVCE